MSTTEQPYNAATLALLPCVNPRLDTNTTVQIDEGILHVQYKSLDSRINESLNDSWAKFFGLTPGALPAPWTVGLILPGETLLNYASGETLEQALSGILAMWGAAKGGRKGGPLPSRCQFPPVK